MSKGNVAIITGASSGMGREFALQIAVGYRAVDEIWIIARRQDRLMELQKKLLGRRVRVFALDLTAPEDMQVFKDVLSEAKPRVRILVNAAGYGMIGKVQELSSKDNLGMVQLNCMSLTEVTYEVLPYMSAGGRIVNLASSAAFMPQPKFAVYAASKSYVMSFSRALHEELREQEITVTAVCPGPVKTEFFDKAETYHEVKLYKKVTMAKPEKVVRQALLDAKHGKAVSVYGGLMNAFRLLCKVFPRSVMMRFVK